MSSKYKQMTALPRILDGVLCQIRLFPSPGEKMKVMHGSYNNQNLLKRVKDFIKTFFSLEQSKNLICNLKEWISSSGLM